MSHKIETNIKQDPNIKINAPPTMNPNLTNKAIAINTNTNPKVFVVIANSWLTSFVFIF